MVQIFQMLVWKSYLTGASSPSSTSEVGEKRRNTMEQKLEKVQEHQQPLEVSMLNGNSFSDNELESHLFNQNVPTIRA